MRLSVCVTDEDYEAWRAVRLAVLPTERCNSVAELRAQETGEELMLLAVEDGVVVGSGMAKPAESAGAAFVAPRVLPAHRRRGVGSALLLRLADHAAGLGLPRVQSGVDDEGCLAFALRFGFVEVDREVEQVHAVGDEPPPDPLPAGVEVVVSSERPELWPACFETFGKQVLADFALANPLDVTAARWELEWAGDPMFLALHEGSVIGCAGLTLDVDRPDRAENALTAVRRDWRGRGVARHLKRRTLQWAEAHDLRELYTWTQAGNTPMRTLNEQLGYVSGQVGITLSRPLPL